MSYIPSAEYYAMLVAHGEITLDAAAHQLSAETHGGLTPLGAADVITHPSETARQLAIVRDNARVGLAMCLLAQARSQRDDTSE